MPVLDRKHAARYRVEERPVVGDEEHRAGEGAESRLERLAALEIEVVRRLVEDEQVRAARDDEGEREPAALAARQRRDGLLVLLPAGEQELPEELLGLRTAEAGGGDGRVEHRPALVKLGLVLGEVRRHDAVAQLDPAGVRFAAPEDGLEERRLPRAVRADERDVLAPLERKRGVLEQPLSPARRDRPSDSTTTRPERAGLRNSKPSARLGDGDRPPEVGIPALSGRSASASISPAWPSCSWRRTVRRTARAGRSSPRPAIR